MTPIPMFLASLHPAAFVIIVLVVAMVSGFAFRLLGWTKPKQKK